MAAVPVIVLTGYLGAGKTTLLNHVLRTPDARIGVVINDFGELNVDAALVTGQIDEPASIAGGCICCLPDEGGLDEALAKLADPRLRLDAIIVEASGLAEPVAVGRMIRFSGVDNVRLGGVVDVIDAATHFETVDRDPTPPARYSASSLVVINKLDQVGEADRESVFDRIEARIRQSNPAVHVVGAVSAKIDAALLFDITAAEDHSGQLSLRELLLDEAAEQRDGHDHAHPHDGAHAASVTATSTGDIDPGALLDLLEEPPAGVYRMKGVVAVRARDRSRRYLVNTVGNTIHIAAAPPKARSNTLVAIGTGLDLDAVRARVENAVRPIDAPAPAAGFRRLQRYRKLSV
ncbi:GTP-binding protein [[Mycobacterium] wendilense]|uniref:GTP-binding protein n=1 Tax=[Mycobacterium] wendilense TaxID=3064284 RepID=A0ABN9P8E5_9MYCO|nr:GTP-binding protein [Mycolicibacterium sp. MU0050]CAJ1586956.1 GTP-binding protein [Mycolicibacterium sp. MU0050]